MWLVADVDNTIPFPLMTSCYDDPFVVFIPLFFIHVLINRMFLRSVMLKPLSVHIRSMLGTCSIFCLFI